MKQQVRLDRHDIVALAIVVVCSPLFAFMQHYQEKAMFGNVFAAFFASFAVGVGITLPLFIYFLIKYTRRLFLSHAV